MKQMVILARPMGFLLLMMCSLVANAQTKLRPMLVEGKTWYYTYHQYNDEKGWYDDRTYRVWYSLRGDTVIDGREYMKMYRYDEPSHQTRYYGAFREDEEGLVWQYAHYNNDKDYMICDVSCSYYYLGLGDLPVTQDVINYGGQLLHRYRKSHLIGVEGVGLEGYGLIRTPSDDVDCYCDYEEFEFVVDGASIIGKDCFTAPTYIELTDNEKKMVEQNNDFAFNLFRKARTGENKVLSPLSITYALGMLNNGAADKTQQEIYDVLGFDDADAQNAFCRKLADELQMAASVDFTTKSKLSNTIFVNEGQGWQLQTDFANTVNQYYDTSPQARDFTDGKTRKVINQWASDHTEGMIPEVLSESEFNPYALCYLLNATCFKGMWSSPFETEDTWDEPFAGGEKVPMMHQKIEAKYAQNNLYQTVELPYGNGTYNMQVFLPREGKTLDEVIESLNGKNWQMKGKTYEVDLSLPRFETDTDQDLVEVMSELGMPSAFVPSMANFSRLCVAGDPNTSFYVGQMKQVAKIKLDEKGSEAAAVTAIGAYATGMGNGYVEFRANHPFFYIISEQSTGIILFMGQYMGEGATGIHTLPLTPPSMEGSIYNLQGQRISVNSVLPKGMYIMDGKKVWVK